jgi:hypothetical protein
MKTVRSAKLGDLDLRLVEKDKQFIGLVLSDGDIKAQTPPSSSNDASIADASPPGRRHQRHALGRST